MNAISVSQTHTHPGSLIHSSQRMYPFLQLKLCTLRTLTTTHEPHNAQTYTHAAHTTQNTNTHATHNTFTQTCTPNLKTRKLTQMQLITHTKCIYFTQTPQS